jgi:hypothetical protein
MSCCCQRVHKFCDVVVCDDQDLVLPITIPADGSYTMELNFLGNVKRQTAPFTAGDTATFSKDPLNETFTYQGHLEGPGGETVEFELDGETFDCFEFTTKRSI